MKWRAWVNRAPAAVGGLVAGVLFGVFTFLVNVGTGLQPLGWPAAVGAAIGALIFGVLMGVGLHYQRKRSGGNTAARWVTEAIKTGRVPDTATAEEWGPLLEHRRRQVKLYGWLGPVEFGLFALLGMFLIVSDRDRVVLWCAGVLFFLALAVVYPLRARKQLPKIDSLKQQLSDRTFAPTSPSGADPDGTTANAPSREDE